MASPEPSPIDGLFMRRVMGHKLWLPPTPYGNGWMMVDMEQRRSIVVTLGEHGDAEWVHASMTGPARVPDYGELCRLFSAVMPGWAYQVFAPPTNHINIHEHALHLWGRLDGENALPDFGRLTI